MKIYQTWYADDPANSETFYPSKAAALKALRSGERLKNHKVSSDGVHTWEYVTYSEYDEHHEYPVTEYCHMYVHDLKPNKEGICHALTNWPHR